jgi:hypothetical protein
MVGSCSGFEKQYEGYFLLASIIFRSLSVPTCYGTMSTSLILSHITGR